MSELEIVELIYLNQEAVGTTMLTITTVFFAYVVCAYLVGSKFDKVTAISTSVIYSLFFAGPVAYLINKVNHTGTLIEHYLASFPNGVLAIEFGNVVGREAAIGMILLPPIAAFIASLFYMHRIVRRRGTA